MESRAMLLAQFTDLLNAHGSESREVREFRARYEADKVLARLFEAAIKIQVQLQTGKLAVKPGDLSSAKSATPKESVHV
jgi:hypothetical protein